MASETLMSLLVLLIVILGMNIVVFWQWWAITLVKGRQIASLREENHRLRGELQKWELMDYNKRTGASS